jgi:hypothetical protein
MADFIRRRPSWCRSRSRSRRNTPRRSSVLVLLCSEIRLDGNLLLALIPLLHTGRDRPRSNLPIPSLEGLQIRCELPRRRNFGIARNLLHRNNAPLIPLLQLPELALNLRNPHRMLLLKPVLRRQPILSPATPTATAAALSHRIPNSRRPGLRPNARGFLPDELEHKPRIAEPLELVQRNPAPHLRREDELALAAFAGEHERDPGIVQRGVRVWAAVGGLEARVGCRAFDVVAWGAGVLDQRAGEVLDGGGAVRVGEGFVALTSGVHGLLERSGIVSGGCGGGKWLGCS